MMLHKINVYFIYCEAPLRQQSWSIIHNSLPVYLQSTITANYCTNTNFQNGYFLRNPNTCKECFTLKNIKENNDATNYIRC